MSYLNVTVTNALGSFTGNIVFGENSPREEVVGALKSLANGVNGVESLTLEDANGMVTIFPQEVLKESVLQVSIID